MWQVDFPIILAMSFVSNSKATEDNFFVVSIELLQGKWSSSVHDTLEL